MDSTTLTLKPIANFDDSSMGKVVSFSIGFDGMIYLVTAMNPLDYRTETDHGSFPKTKGDTPQSYRVYRYQNDEFLLLMDIESEPSNIHCIQPLPYGRILLVGSRCEYNDGDPEQNAIIYSAKGKKYKSFTMGDGIEDVRVTPDGKIWANYFDEGIFGNLGWNEPLGASGLVAWNSDGHRLYQCTEVIHDCYAMTTSGDDVWIYYYSDFKLAHIKGLSVVKSFDIPISGSHIFAISDTHALFGGGYNDNQHYYLIPLNCEQPKISKAIEVHNQKGQLIEGWCVSYGDTIFMMTDSGIYKLSIQAVLDK